jgi:archaellum biogenesis ATPase FlaH
MSLATSRYKISSGYDSVVRKLRKDIHESNSVLIVEGDRRCSELMLNAFRRGDYSMVCYISLNKSFSFLTSVFRVKGIDLDKFFFIDGITQAMMDNLPREKGCIFLKSPKDLDGLRQAFEKAARRKPDFVVIDSLSSLMLYHDTRKVAGLLGKLLDASRHGDAKTITFVSKDDWNRRKLKSIKKLVDKVVIIN